MSHCQSHSAVLGQKVGWCPTLPIPPTTCASSGACSVFSQSLYNSWYAARFTLRCIISYLLPRGMCPWATNCAVLHITARSHPKLKYEVGGHLQGNFCWSMGTWLTFFITRGIMIFVTLQLPVGKLVRRRETLTRGCIKCGWPLIICDVKKRNNRIQFVPVFFHKISLTLIIMRVQGTVQLNDVLLIELCYYRRWFSVNILDMPHTQGRVSHSVKLKDFH